jgi:hypothetical protein
MGIFDFFKKKEDPGENDSITDLVLDKMRPGYFVDYDLTTWEVTGAHRYDWDGDESYEWQLSSAKGVIYLGMECDDEKDWSVSSEIDLKKLDASVISTAIEQGDPPASIIFEGEKYDLYETSGGLFFQDGQHKSQVQGRELIVWDYENEDGSRYLSIEQWGETEFKAYSGIPAQEYQFSNILPGS